MTELMRNWKARLLIDGVRQQDLHVGGFRLECTRYARCDTALIRVVTKNKTVLRGLVENRSGFDRPDVMLQVAQGDEEWTTVFHGVLDALNKENGNALFVLECRDYMAFLLDTRLAASWSNQTALELVQEAVQRAGLTFRTDIVSGTTDAAAYCGQFWQLEHRRLSAVTQNRYQTAFDIAFSLSRDHGYECHASGKTIHIHEPYAVGEGGTRLFSPDGVSVQSFRHDLGLARNVVVGVQSWDSRQRARSEVYFDGQNFSSEMPGANAALYTFRAPGLRMDDIRRLAKGKYRRIVSHACEVRLSLPAMTGLAPRHFMTVDEGISDGVRTLSVDSVTHFMDPAHGYRQDVTLRDRVF
ncbi:hypothetical protein HW511_00560 [Asaia siamensis]|uniref:Phage protein D n=1 Tax=Asaia siamensis TaxID=110479 RepID=A0ABQ1M4C5_9PROT|nr:hypothetical protein [Asaia siamensis]GBR06242.1 hypothetical protein AA0323_1320 [Asaia siamensis NRIC 0323]GGC34739.1 hypothetical protein GCM10007207_20320 [Asaia siamensis]